MAVRPIPLVTDDPFERLGLPGDYPSLSADGQRLARINACRQFLVPGSGDEQAARFVRSLDFFDSYYLKPETDEDGDVIFDPYFYDMWLEPPQFHKLFSFAMWKARMSAGVAMRGGAKTKLTAKEVLMLMTACPVFGITYATSTNDLTQTFGERAKAQFEFNERLNDDWGPEYGGQLKGDRGAGSWGMTNFTLRNRSSLFCTSAESRQRGLRPRVYYLDDPEYDPKQSTSTELLRQGAEHLIFRVALPMVLRAGTKLCWRGTFVSKQHYLWIAIQTHEVMKEGVMVEEPIDPRFGKWYRIIVPLVLDKADGTKQSAWSHQWPIDNAEKERLGLAEDTLTVPEVEEMMGPAAFQAEMMANPGDAGLKHFGDVTEESNGYWFENEDAALASEPWRSNTLVCWWRGREVQRVPLAKLRDLGGQFYSITDTSFTDTVTSDYKANGVFCILPTGEGFMFDLFAAKCAQSRLIDEMFTLADRWRVQAMYVEAVKQGATIVTDIAGAIRDNSIAILKEWNYIPAVIPYNPGVAPKESRIAAALTRRMQLGLVKLPVRKFNTFPWSMLYQQIMGFNPVARDGGLQNDDCFPAGTLVWTQRGEVPIESITTDDWVMTRWGLKKVHRAWMTGVKEVITRFGITATPNHPVWTENRGWVELALLRGCDTIKVCPTRHIQTALQRDEGPSSTRRSQERQSSGRGGFTTDTQTPSGPTTVTTTGAMTDPTWVLDHSTEISGSPCTGQCLRGTTYTTRTRTISTTPLRTWSALLTRSISKSIGKLIDWWGYVTWRPAPWTGLGSSKGPWSSSARGVGESSEPRTEGGTFTVVEMLAGENGSASTAELADRVLVPTWNLTVEGPPEFYANGVLVHNCLNILADAFSPIILRGMPEVPHTSGNKPTDYVADLLAGRLRDTKTGMPTFLLALPNMTVEQYHEAVAKTTAPATNPVARNLI